MVATTGQVAGLVLCAILGPVAAALTLDEWWERRKARQRAKDLWYHRADREGL